MSIYRASPPAPLRAPRASLWRRLGASLGGEQKVVSCSPILAVFSWVLSPGHAVVIALVAYALLVLSTTRLCPRRYRWRRAWLRFSWRGIGSILESRYLVKVLLRSAVPPSRWARVRWQREQGLIVGFDARSPR